MEIQLWKEILSPYEQAVDELLVKFNHIIMQYKSMGKYSPIESVTGRVKRSPVLSISFRRRIFLWTGSLRRWMT